MSTRWKAFVENKPWSRARALHIHRAGSPPGSTRTWPEPDAVAIMHTPLFTTIGPGIPYAAEEPPRAFLEGHATPAGDEVGDFLQAMLDAAWELGLRPAGYADHKNELAAVRDHLKDMRFLALIANRKLG